MPENIKIKTNQLFFISFSALLFVLILFLSSSLVKADEIIVEYATPPSPNCTSDYNCSTLLCVGGNCVNCTTNADCNRTTNYCSGGICTTPPAPNCTSDYNCSTLLCVGGNCVNCTTNADCARTTGFCSGGKCSTPPECTPGQNRSCYSGSISTSGIGRCQNGTQTCTGAGTWGGCIGELLPINETCNNIDEDCNGIVDDNTPSRSCALNHTGICAIGNETCTSGTYGGCPLPQNETCNGLDDNCDGTIDEGCLCIENTTRQCGPPTQTGSCRFGTQACLGVAWGNCTGAVYPQPEICGNGIDEACAGTDQPCPECTLDAQCASGKCVGGTCLSQTFLQRTINRPSTTSPGTVESVFVAPGEVILEPVRSSSIIPNVILKTFGVATERKVKTCEIGLRCSTDADCYDSKCITGTCACCIQTCLRTADCCGGYCEDDKCKLPPRMEPFIVRKPAYSGCTGLIQECLPGEGGCISICNAMTILLAFVAAGTLFAFWKIYKHPVVGIIGGAIPFVVAVISYPFAGIIVAILLIGLMFAK